MLDVIIQEVSDATCFKELNMQNTVPGWDFTGRGDPSMTAELTV